MNAAPKKAFVLAAGFGTRMLPLTKTVPKPLLPLWGRPLLMHTLEMLRAWGVREVCINVHHLPRAITDYLAAHPVRGLSIGFSPEAEILGTGGALPHARWFLEDGEPFWMVNADVAMRLDPAPLLRAFHGDGVLAACWLQGGRGPRTVEMAEPDRAARVGHRAGFIEDFRSRRPGTQGTYTFCGVQVLSPRLLDFLPATGFSTIIDGYEAAMRVGHRIAGVEVPKSYWADLGTPADYLAAHGEWKSRQRFVARGRAVEVAASAVVANSVLMDGVQVGARAQVRDAIIGPGAHVHGSVTGLAMRARDALAAPELHLLRQAGWPEEATAILLGPRGSNRAFTRVQAGRRTGMLIHYDPARHENTLYASHARFLAAAGFPAPAVLADDPLRHVTLLEDLGDDSLQATLRTAPEAEQFRVYRKVLDAVLTLHGEASRRARKARLEMVPAFRPRLYQWERAYFAEHMLEKRLGLPEEQVALIVADLRKVGRQLLRAPPVVVHRDLQSSNVILRRGRPWFIDFQGMRWGPAVYDLASLLADPYMELSESLQLRLLAYYAARCPEPEQIRALFWPAAIQRLAQALGAYAKLGAARDTRAFGAYIPPALRMMGRALRHVRGLPHLSAWCAAQATEG